MDFSDGPSSHFFPNALGSLHTKFGAFIIICTIFPLSALTYLLTLPLTMLHRRGESVAEEADIVIQTGVLTACVRRSGLNVV